MEQHLDPPFTRHVRFLSLSLHRICPHGEITKMTCVGTPVLDSSVPVRSLFLFLCFVLFPAVLHDDSFCPTTTNDRSDSHRPDIAAPLFIFTPETTKTQPIRNNYNSSCGHVAFLHRHRRSKLFCTRMMLLLLDNLLNFFKDFLNQTLIS